MIKVIITVIILAVVIVGVMFYTSQSEISDPVACTLEAKICPDGSAVGRTGPNCEFAPCPALKQIENIIFGNEAVRLCGPGPPALCAYGLKLGCDSTNKKWDCYSSVQDENISD